MTYVACTTKTVTIKILLYCCYSREIITLQTDCEPKDDFVKDIK